MCVAMCKCECMCVSGYIHGCLSMSVSCVHMHLWVNVHKHVCLCIQRHAYLQVPAGAVLMEAG